MAQKLETMEEEQWQYYLSWQIVLQLLLFAGDIARLLYLLQERLCWLAILTPVIGSCLYLMNKEYVACII